MAVPSSALAALSRQLGHPRGPGGRVVGRLLNRTNRVFVAEAVDSLHLLPGGVAADVGFGGGLGLALLLDRVGAAGVVHGVEVSETMLAQAGRRFRRETAAGRLALHCGGMQQLPLPDACLDGVVSTNTIYFLDDLEGAFTELARVLRPGARLSLGVGDPTPMEKMPFTRHGFTLRPIDVVVDALVAAGLWFVEDRRVGDGEHAFHVLVAEQPET